MTGNIDNLCILYFIEAPYCNRTIDWMGGCWPDTLPGSIAKIPCPALPSFNEHGKNQKVSK